MSLIITDGKGTDYSAEVDSNNRLVTRATTETESQFASGKGDAYNVNTGNINLTSGNPSATLWFENTSSRELFIDAFFYLFGTSTGGSGDILVQVFRNPTAGTITSSGTAFNGVNRNFSSTNELGGNLYRGAEGLTVTGGTVVIESIFTGSGRSAISVGKIVLGKGNTIAWVMTPQTGNTSMDVQFAFGCHYKAF